MAQQTDTVREMPRPPTDSVQITMRVPQAWLADVDALAAFLSRPGMNVTRTDAFRAALAKGLEVLGAEAKAAKK